MQSHSIRALYMPSGDCTWKRRTLLPNQEAALVLCRDRSSRAFPAPQPCPSPRPCPNSRLGSWRLQGRRTLASMPAICSQCRLHARSRFQCSLQETRVSSRDGVVRAFMRPPTVLLSRAERACAGGHSFHQSGHRAIPRSHLVAKSGGPSLASKTAVGESTHCAGRTASRRRPLATFRPPVQS
ncbi:uncharacterized protein SCHCODRAFT_02281959 [Schizophyllum commune H4-8]|uniref:uncharacterized protein n=1 Tax=Schizophyllum commune (strain H4-8 / FGSC 9210) TaxID=578458 RepID=UPI00215EA405|nr:uncharacterized protein SCHCODRAFT_02281959 [Schizophyllum commune H4-8]KAI5892063.1 hypothetical protein SCHCODRAFT_02281959 [Schizophyllum commune H4-8]